MKASGPGKIRRRRRVDLIAQQGERMIRYFQIAVAVAACLLALRGASADDGSPKKLPKSGLLASTSITGASNTVVTDAFGGEDLTGTDVAPITGSVSRKGSENFTFRVFNNTKDTYSFSVSLRQRDDNGSVVKYGSFSFSLKGGESDSRDVQRGFNASGADLTLDSYKNLSAQRRDP
jgi:hypothetical protein